MSYEGLNIEHMSEKDNNDFLEARIAELQAKADAFDKLLAIVKNQEIEGVNIKWRGIDFKIYLMDKNEGVFACYFPDAIDKAHQSITK